MTPEAREIMLTREKNGFCRYCGGMTVREKTVLGAVQVCLIKCWKGIPLMERVAINDELDEFEKARKAVSE